MITDDPRKVPRQVVEYDKSATLHTPLLEANRQVHGASLHHSATNVLDREDTRYQLSQKNSCFLNEMVSLLPGGDAEFPDSTDMMASLLPGGDAEFPDSADMMASLLPGGDAEFPDSIDMMASLLHGGDAEFPDSTDMMASLLHGGDAEFPDSTDMMASLLPGGDAEFPDPTEMGATKAFTNGTYADSSEGGRTVP